MISSVRRCMAVVATALAVWAPAAAWSAVSFTGSFGITGNALSDPGLVVETNRAGGGLNFTLDVGNTFSMPLFDIWTNETSVNADDTVPENLRVSFNFSTVGAGAVDGTTVGVRALRGLIQYGQVVWNNPVILTFGETRLSVSLTDAVFNTGLAGLDNGSGSGATVLANFTLLSAPAPSPVPLPASALLLLGGLGAGGLTLRLRRRRNGGEAGASLAAA